MAEERERFKKAEKVTSWDGWVYCDGFGNNGFAKDLDELFMASEPDELPDYVWTCEPNHFAHFGIDEIVERICEQGYEDFEADDLKGVDELKAALEKFNEANAAICSYEPNYNKVLLINRAEFISVSESSRDA